MTTSDPPAPSLDPAGDKHAGPPNRSDIAAAWRRAHERLPWLWPYGWLVAVIAIAMWPAWTTTGGLFISGDAMINYFPWFVLWRDQLGAGELPLWNPYTFSGSPAFAAPHAGYGYPVTWALTPLPAEMALNWFVALHIVFAGVGTAWAAGRLGATRDGQFLAGIVFALGGAMAARLVSAHIFFIAGIAWLPIATGLAATANQRFRVPALAAVIGMLALSAQPELLIFAVWWLPLWAGAIALREGRRRAVVAVLRTLGGIALGIGLAAFFLIPVAEYQTMSNRANDLDWEFRTGISLPLWHVLTLINPEVFGASTDGTYWPGEVFVWHENLLFIGLVPLLVAGFARGRAAWACFGLSTFALALAFGRYLPLYGLIDFLPGYELFRNPPKHLLLVGLALAFAAGLGLPRIERRTLAVVSAGGAALLLAAGLTTTAWLPLFVELLGGSESITTTEGLRDVAGEAETPLLLSACVLAALAVVASVSGRWFRQAVIGLAVLELALVLQPYWSEPSDPDVIAREAATYAGDPDVAITGDGALLANYGPVVKVRQPSGYTSQFSGGYMELVVGDINPSVVINVEPGDERLLYLLGYGAFSERGSGVVDVFDPPPPEAWVAGCVWPGGALEVREADFPIRDCVTSFQATERDAVAPSQPAEVLDRGTRSLTVTAAGPGWLITTIPWYPGWSARVDGRDANIEVLDGALVGVGLAPGEHVVSFSYWPAGLTLGLLISGLSLLTIIGLFVAERGNDSWTRLGLEPLDRVVADESDDDSEEEAPEDDGRQVGPA